VSALQLTLKVQPALTSSKLAVAAPRPSATMALAFSRLAAISGRLITRSGLWAGASSSTPLTS